MSQSAVPKAQEAKAETERTSLYELVAYAPLPFPDRKAMRKRRDELIQACHNVLPIIAFSFMFDTSATAIRELMRRRGIVHTRAESNRLFRRFFERQSFADLKVLNYLERTYLANLQWELNFARAKYQLPDPEATARELSVKLADAAKAVPGKRAPCTNPSCENRFPPTGDFFPNLRHGGKKPGRCALCVYLQKAQYRKTRKTAAARRPHRRLSAAELKRFHEIEEALGSVLPNRVLARLFKLSRSGVNQRRKQPLARLKAKEIFHAFQTLEEEPRYDALDDAENAVVAEEWRAIRAELPRGLWSSREEHRKLLLQHTAACPNLPRQRCPDCDTEYAADNICFPHRWNRPRTKKRLMKTCRPCYADKWPPGM